MSSSGAVRKAVFLRWIACGVALASAVACRHTTETREASRPPREANVLLVTLDTTRADHLSCYGPSGARTPHLDALAARGVRFAHATAQVPLTLPSHACVMTGAYPPVHGLRDMGGFVLDRRHPTIASIAQSAGFETAAFVGSRVLATHFGLSNGFATYDDNMGGEPEEDKLPGVFPERRAAVVTDRALEWLKANASRKFFLWAHYYDPHAPYDPPAPYRKTYAKDLYSGEIAYTDEHVGRLLDGLERLGLASRTLIAVIGDHGESLGEHGELTHGIFLYDSTLRVPFIMAGPDAPAGKVIEDQVRSIDLAPTVLEFLNLPKSPETQGVSLWPLVRGGERVRSNWSYAETLYPRTYMGWSELRAMRADRWKLILAPRSELYALDRDSSEGDNIIARHPAEADQLQKKIWEVSGAPLAKEKVVSTPLDPQTRQELESLGYVGAGTPREILLGTSAADPKDRVAVVKVFEGVEQAINRRAYAEAAARMERGLTLDPTNPLGHIYLATAYERMGRFSQAIAVYEDALKTGAATDQIYSRLGKDYLREGRIGKAAEAMARAAEINPTDADNLRNLGTAYLQLGRAGDAEKTFKVITVQNKNYAAAYNGLGLVAVRRGNAEAARENFQHALQLDPHGVEPMLNLGLLYQKLGDKEQAIRYYKLFLAEAPRDQYSSMVPQVRGAIREMEGGT